MQNYEPIYRERVWIVDQIIGNNQELTHCQLSPAQTESVRNCIIHRVNHLINDKLIVSLNF